MYISTLALLLIVSVIQLTQSAVIMRRSPTAEINTATTEMSDRGDQMDAAKMHWPAEEAKEALRELQHFRMEKERESTTKSSSPFNWLTSFFLAKSADHSSPEQYRQRQMLNNCFFSPMNCRVAPQGRKTADGKQKSGAIILLNEEELQKLLETLNNGRKPAATEAMATVVPEGQKTVELGNRIVRDRKEKRRRHRHNL